MAYIFVKILPNHIPVTAGNPVHYSKLNFLIYKSEFPPGEKEKLIKFQVKNNNTEKEYDSQNGDNQKIKKGPRIVISAKTVPPGSCFSEDALCVSNDIPPAGYSFTAPEGWSCSYTYDNSANQVSFVFAAPAEGGSGFTAESVYLNSFFTTAQEGVCTLEVRVENFSKYVPSIDDCTFSIPLSKRYSLEILKFTANGLRGSFFLNHNLPSLFEWDVICDRDTPLQLLVDGTFDSALQEFTGERDMETREKGEHTYTLKMILPEGEKTESIKIKDTRWRKIERSCGLVPDFTKQNVLLSWKDNILVSYAGKVYQTTLDKDYKLDKWNLLTTYDGKVEYSAAAAVVCEDKLFLIGGTKSDSGKMFYSVYDLSAEKGKWTDFHAGQFSTFAKGAAAGSSEERYFWIVYAKQTGDSIFFMEYMPEEKRFNATYMLEIAGIKSFAIGIRKDRLYLAVSTKDGILLKTWKRGEKDFCEAGRIAASPDWMQWIKGNNRMFLMTDKGLYQENGWENIEDFQPSCPAGNFLWSGDNGGRIVSLISAGEDSENYEVWVTDIL